MVSANRPKISLCCITGMEMLHVERFLNSFAPAFDELCIVVAVGNQDEDATLALARAWCEKNGKEFRSDQYFNAGWDKQRPTRGQTPNDGNPATWPHVDDFAYARNLSWGLATGEWQFWADLDDVLVEGSADIIREYAASGQADMMFFKYAIRTSMEEVMRERLFRTGISQWKMPVHENCVLNPKSDGTLWKITEDVRVIFAHQPESAKPRDPMRNIRIMQHALHHLEVFPISLVTEWFYRWQQAKYQAKDTTRTEECEGQFLHWSEIANQTTPPHLAETRLQLYLMHAEVYREKDLPRALDLCWEAIRLAPGRREGWGHLAELELRAGRAPRADVASHIMGNFGPNKASVVAQDGKFIGWEGLLLRTRCLRANGREDFARANEENIFVKNGSRISLLHATRGRPQMALTAKSNFFKSAVRPLGIEHIFAIDADDAESLDALKHHRHVVIEEPNGCVKAWNRAAAACSGNVLVQLSDDWLPCNNWDELIWLALEEEATKRATGNPMPLVPLVLAISDNHRTDSLLCMAILTRARYHEQTHGLNTSGEPNKDESLLPVGWGRHLFFPGYFGVYSDTEFTVRAYDAGIVVQAKHIVVDHQHPIWLGKPIHQWDDTHRRQNEGRRYAEGKALFNYRNPKHAVA